MTTRSQDLLLGVLFFATLITIGLVTILLADLPLGVRRHDVELLSADVGYLRVGDPVLLQGMPAGKVEALERLSEPVPVTGPDGRSLSATVRVHARLDIDPYALLREDHEVVIEERGLLGGRLVRLEPGRAGPTIERDTTLVAVSRPSLTQAAIAFIEGDDGGGLGDALVTFSDTMHDLGEGRGTLPMLIHDEQVAADVRAGIADLATLAADVRGGDGTLSRLIRDPALHDETRALVAEWTRTSDALGGVVDRVDRGEGSLGRLVTDGALVAQAERFFTSSATLVDDVRAGQGTLGRLVVDARLHDEVERFFADASRVAGQLSEGEGLLPALLSDPGMRADLERILQQALAGIEDARETAPVQDLGSFLFGTF